MFKSTHVRKKTTFRRTMTTCLGTMMSDSTKLYNTVQVQKLEAELQLVSVTLTSDLRPPWWHGYICDWQSHILVHSYWIITIITD